MKFINSRVHGRPFKAALTLGCVLPAVVLLLAPGARAQSQKVDASDFMPAATVVEIMDSMVMSSAQVLWDAVSVDVTENGTIEKVPQTDEDWAKVRWSAVTLAEATNALIVPGRKVAPPGTVSAAPDAELGPEDIQKLLDSQRPAWIAHAHVLHEAAMESLRAIDAKNVEALSDAGGTIDAACEGCHLQFWYPQQQ